MPAPRERGSGGGLLERGEVEDAPEEVVGELGQAIVATGHCLRRRRRERMRCDQGDLDGIPDSYVLLRAMLTGPDNAYDPNTKRQRKLEI